MWRFSSPWVRIPPSPPRKNVFAKRITFNVAGTFKFGEFITSRSMFYVYILESQKDNSLYIGYTSNLKKRYKKHNSGENKATKPFRPYKLIYYEAFLDQKDAKARERYLKSGWGRRTVKKLLKAISGRGRSKNPWRIPPSPLLASQG